MGDLQFWILTTAFLILVGLVGFFYRKADNAEKSLMRTTALHIQETVEDLANTIKESTAENKLLYSQNEHRVSAVEKDVAEIKARCYTINRDYFKTKGL